ncbi:MAG: DUF6089 family protein [Bacteroidales bacterium]
MNHTKKYFIICFLIILPVLSYSQRWKLQRAEITGGIGGVHYFGDIGGTAEENNWMGLKDIEIVNTRPNINIGGRYRLQEDMSIKANVVFGYLEGDDANSKNEARNYAFSSSVLEVSGQFEYSIIPEGTPVNFTIGNLRRGLKSSSATLNTYVFAGLGGVFFNVKPLDDLEDSDRFDDSQSMSLVIPLGAGIKYPLTNRMHIGFELGGRWTSTDYIDGFTSRFSKHNDIYYFTMLNVVFKIETLNRRLFKF